MRHPILQCQHLTALCDGVTTRHPHEVKVKARVPTCSISQRPFTFMIVHKSLEWKSRSMAKSMCSVCQAMGSSLRPVWNCRIRYLSSYLLGYVFECQVLIKILCCMVPRGSPFYASYESVMSLATYVDWLDLWASTCLSVEQLTR